MKLAPHKALEIALKVHGMDLQKTYEDYSKLSQHFIKAHAQAIANETGLWFAMEEGETLEEFCTPFIEEPHGMWLTIHPE